MTKRRNEKPAILGAPYNLDPTKQHSGLWGYADRYCTPQGDPYQIIADFWGVSRAVAKRRVLGNSYILQREITGDPADDGIEVTIIRIITERTDDYYRKAILLAKADRYIEDCNIVAAERVFCRKVGVL